MFNSVLMFNSAKTDRLKALVFMTVEIVFRLRLQDREFRPLGRILSDISHKAEKNV